MDEADQAFAAADREVEARLADIRRLNADPRQPAPALRTCVDCPDPIEAARLAANPRALRCAPCQREHEAAPVRRPRSRVK